MRSVKAAAGCAIGSLLLSGCGQSASNPPSGTSPGETVPALSSVGQPTHISASPRPSRPTPPTDTTRLPASPPPPSSTAQPIVISYSVGEHPHFDRVVFVFLGGHPRWRARYVTQVVVDASGAPVPLEGQAFLSVTFEGAAAHRAQGPTDAMRPLSPHLAVLRDMKPTGDFEGYVSYGLGLSRQTAYQFFVLTRPDRVVLDLIR